MQRIGVALLLVLGSGTALADTVTIQSYRARSAFDGQPGQPPDGHFDGMVTGNIVYVDKTAGANGHETRGNYEFVLPPEVMQAGVMINQVMVKVPLISQAGAGNRTFSVYGLQHDIPYETALADFDAKGEVSQFQVGEYWPYPDVQFYIPYWLQIFPGTQQERVSLVVASQSPEVTLQLQAAGATMTIDYTPAHGNPPSLDIITPNDGDTYNEGEVIRFQAQTWDVEDGDRSWGIRWQSSISGEFAWGGFADFVLPVGTHVVQATLMDFDGNQVARARTITVIPDGNTPPTIAITSPADGSQLLQADPATHFTATSTDAEQGSLDASIEWWLDGNTRLGSGADIATILPIDWHTVTARVRDAGGKSAEATISVHTDPLRPDYCTARGNTSSAREWIGLVAMDSIVSQSGATGPGYTLFSNPQFTGNAGLTRTINLGARFNGASASESWGVWIDLDRDKEFSAAELLVTGNSSGLSVLTRPFTIPAGTANGPTRMRVVMRNGAPATACGTYARGEVEDYTINIQGGTSAPPATAYCRSRGVHSFEWIRTVQVGTSASYTVDDGGYRDDTAVPRFPLSRTVPNNVTLRGANTAGYRWAAWIDYNHDLEFSAGERVLFGTGSNGNFLGSVPVPAAALPGNTRMRVQMSAGEPIVSACQTLDIGEVEEYTVTIP